MADLDVEMKASLHSLREKKTSGVTDVTKTINTNQEEVGSQISGSKESAVFEREDSDIQNELYQFAKD